MDSAARKTEIMKRLENHGHINIAQLASEFDVSLMTIRRDIKELAADPRIIVGHGSARIAKDALYERNVSLQQTILVEEKRAIAKKCLEFIHPGDCIYLGTGSTVMELAELLRNRTDIVIVTNSLLVIDVLKDCAGMRIISLSGKYDIVSMGFVGQYASEAAKNFYFNYSFMSPSTVDIKAGICLPIARDGLFRRTILENSDQNIIMCDYTKFDQHQFFKVCDLKDISMIVTDYNTDKEIVDRYSEHVKMLVAEKQEQ